MEKAQEIVVYAFRGYQSYWFETLLEWYDVGDVTFKYINKFPKEEIENTNFDDTYQVIFYGVDLSKSQTGFLNKHFGNLFDLPFADVYAFGDKVDQEVFDLGIRGVETEDLLTDTLDSLQGELNLFEPMGMEWSVKDVVSNAISSYNKGNYGSQAVNIKVIADMWKDDLKTFTRKPKSLNEMKDTFKQTVERGKKDIQNLIELKYHQARWYNNNETTIGVIYADYGYDEIASRLADKDNMIFLFVKHTAGDDMVHIRTSEDLDALTVAKVFRPNNSYGNSRGAYFFLNNTPGSIGSALTSYYFNS